MSLVSWRQSTTARARGMPLAASSSRTSAPVAQAPVLVLVPPGRLILSNRISPSCFGEPRLNFSPGVLVGVGLEGGGALGEVAGEPREDLAIDGDAAGLHAGEDGGEGALDGFVERGGVLGDEAGRRMRQRRKVRSASSAAYFAASAMGTSAKVFWVLPVPMRSLIGMPAWPSQWLDELAHGVELRAVERVAQQQRVVVAA